MTTVDFRHAPAAEAAQALDAQPDPTMRELQAALANALERIGSLQREWDELGELFKAFNEMADAAKLHGPGVLNRQ